VLGVVVLSLVVLFAVVFVIVGIILGEVGDCLQKQTKKTKKNGAKKLLAG